jgi:signal transduction histidine kinase
MDVTQTLNDTPELHERLAAEQVRIHFTQLPAIIIAPSLGGLFSAWVLWGAVDNRFLVIGMSAILLISALRVLLYRWYFSSPAHRQYDRKWKFFAIFGALVSGIIWGSAALFLYPPLLPEYSLYLVVLLALVPVAPVAALAVYMPAFYAYYLPCISPYIITLAMEGDRPAQMTALLLIMMLGATINFAREYAKTLTETLRLRLQLTDKKEALEHTARVKTHFLAAASHDLRQPVHAMGLFIEILRPRLSDRKNLKLLNHIKTAFQGLRGMLDEMLDISRLDAEVVEVHKRSFAAHDLLQRLAQEYAPLAVQKGLRLRCVIHEAVVFSDASQLEHIIRNLLDNALKYTIQGGFLLACRQRGKHVLIQVYDTGPGIPEQKMREIFLEFTQIDNPERNPGQGLGLGLAIVERLTRLLEHEIRVRSIVGRGSVFSLMLEMGRDSPTPATLPAAETATTIRPRVQSLLVIDDDDAIRAGMVTLLQQWGCQVIAADSANTALARLREVSERPDVMIVDYRLAGGKTALEAIGDLHNYLGSPVPAIIVTGDTAPARIREAHDSGFLLLHKPLAPDRLKLGINSLASSSFVVKDIPVVL